MSRRSLTVLLWVGLVALFAGLYSYFSASEPKGDEMTMADLFSEAKDGRIKSVELQGKWLVVEGKTGPARRAALGRYRREDVRDYLANSGIEVTMSATSDAVDRFLPFVPLLLLAVIVVVFLRQRNGVGSVLTLRRTNARLVPEPPSVTFDDVGGNEEAKVRLRDVVGFLREPARWAKTGARPPRGVLLEGPPGNGKTLLARALAGEAKVRLFTSSGADFVELFVGVGAARMRDLFETAQKQGPCIVFIDELDAVARKRGAASASLTHQEREQTLNQLLVCLDGFSPLSQVIVVAATNRADVLDPALLRPGRFDVRLTVKTPDEQGRRRILELHTRKKPLAGDVNLDVLAARAEGASGAELEHLANEAALTAVREGRERITMADFEGSWSRRHANAVFDTLDAVLLEGNAQLSQPASALQVTVTLVDREVHGELVWVDPTSLKLRLGEGSVVVSRQAIRVISARGAGPASVESLQRGAPTVDSA